MFMTRRYHIVYRNTIDVSKVQSVLESSQAGPCRKSQTVLAYLICLYRYRRISNLMIILMRLSVLSNNAPLVCLPFLIFTIARAEPQLIPLPTEHLEYPPNQAQSHQTTRAEPPINLTNKSNHHNGLPPRANPPPPSPPLNPKLNLNPPTPNPIPLNTKPQAHHPKKNPLRLRLRTLPLLSPSKLLVGPNGPLSNPPPNEPPPPRIHRLLPLRRNPRLRTPLIRNPKLPRHRLRRRNLRRICSENNPIYPRRPSTNTHPRRNNDSSRPLTGSNQHGARTRAPGPGRTRSPPRWTLQVSEYDIGGCAGFRHWAYYIWKLSTQLNHCVRTTIRHRNPLRSPRTHRPTNQHPAQLPEQLSARIKAWRLANRLDDLADASVFHPEPGYC